MSACMGSGRGVRVLLDGGGKSWICAFSVCERCFIKMIYPGYLEYRFSLIFLVCETLFSLSSSWCCYMIWMLSSGPHWLFSVLLGINGRRSAPVVSWLCRLSAFILLKCLSQNVLFRKNFFPQNILFRHFFLSKCSF